MTMFHRYSKRKVIMIKKLFSLSFIGVVLLLLSGCGSNSIDNGEATKGPSSGGSKTIGSLSGSEDIAAYLEKRKWTGISIDLNKYLYDTASRAKTYTIEMRFVKGKVDVLADCSIITARYRIKDDEITFSRISSPKPAIDNPSCREFKDADNAISAFFSSGYVVNAKTADEAMLEATDIETSVTLTR